MKNEIERFETAFKDELNLFLTRITKKEEFENYVMQLLEQTYETAHDNGWFKGFDEGYKHGESIGYNEGWKDNDLPF